MKRTDLNMGLLVVRILVVSAVVFIFANYGRHFLVAQEEPVVPKIKSPEIIRPPEGPIIEYVSNEILIRLKPQAQKKLKAVFRPHDTGLSSLNKLNKEHKITKFQRIAKPTKKTKIKDKDHPIFRWYKITLPGKQEIIKEKILEERNEFGEPIIKVTVEEKEEPGKRLKKIAKKYQANPDIEKVELNYVVQLFSTTPNDPYFHSSDSWGQGYDDLWGLKKISASEAWDITTGSEDVVVAVVDTGVDYNHPDLVANIWTNEGEIPNNGIDDDNNCFIDDYYGFDFSDSEDKDNDGCYNSPADVIDSDPMDEHGHGTHVAGTIGAVGNNNLGVVGVNWKVKIMPVKIFPKAYVSNIVPAIIYAAENGAKVMNNSWGGWDIGAEAIHNAINYAWSLDVTIVAAAGNSFGADADLYMPANDHRVIAVSSTDHNDKRSDFSNSGSKIDVAAPGGDSWNYRRDDFHQNFVNILSLRADDTDMYCNPKYPETCGKKIVDEEYYRASGTSMAAPHVSGLVALILSQHPDLRPKEIKHILRNSADKVSGKYFDIEGTGYGRINAAEALQSLQSDPYPAPPIARITRPRTGRTFLNPDFITITGQVGSRYGLLNYKVKLFQGKEPYSNLIETLDENTVETTLFSGTLFILDTSQLSSGYYNIGVEVEDLTSGKISKDFILILIERDIVSGWPQNIRGAGIAVGDINGDGKEEVVIPSWYMNSREYFEDQGRIYVLDYNGNPLDGLSLRVGQPDAKYVFLSNPTLYDINQDGAEEIILTEKSLIQNPDNSKTLISQIHVLDGRSAEELSGWPKELLYETIPPPPPGTIAIILPSSLTPAVADLDDNGAIEIIGSIIPYTFSQIKVYIWESDGSSVPSDWDWPKTISERISSTLVIVSDLDGNGAKELLLKGKHTLYIWDYKGNNFPGWPQVINEYPSHIAVGDMDFDNKKEILVTSYPSDDNPIWETKVFLWKFNGEKVANWPISIPMWTFAVPPIFVDLDLDKRDETAFFMNGSLYAYKYDATLVPGFPSLSPNNLGDGVPIAADLDGDKYPEIIVQSLFDPFNPKVLIFNNKGDIIFERPYGWTTASPEPLVTDLDNNDSGEIIFTTEFTFDRWFVELGDLFGGKAYYYKFFLLRTNFPDLGSYSWRMLRHDATHTGCLTPFRFTPPCDSFGDVDLDGFVTESDAEMVLQHVVGTLTLTEEQQRRADVNWNGEVEAVDAMFIQQYVEGIIDTFPVCILDTDNDGMPDYLDDDDDNDGFTDEVELYIGTDPLSACGDDAWPPDFNNDRVVNILDVLGFKGKLGTSLGDPNYTPRYDLNANGEINILDVLLMKPYIGKSCQ